jgi:hypothetical protein
MENNPYIITKVDQYYDPGKKPRDQGRLARANMRVFLSSKITDRPGMSNIMEDFAWRRGGAEASHQRLCSDKKLKEIIVNKLKELKMLPDNNDISLEFNSYTGCSMCPCSPGIVVKISRVAKERVTPALWIDLKSNQGDENNES